MSQIFDALQLSETERSGTIASAAKELLEVVERHSGPSAAADESSKAAPGLEKLRQDQVVPITLSPQNKFVCMTDPEGLAAEKFRFLGVRLRHVQQKRAIKRILVTSSVAGEGKSTVAGNLACALAGSKQKVLLLEGDLRRPALAEQLGLREFSGLCEWLETSSSQPGNIYRLENLNLWFLPAGRSQGNPLEFMQPAKLATLMDRLAASFDWIVIDSPPVLPLADTSIWMRLADAILLVTRPGTTPKRQLQRSLEAMEQSKLFGAVLNASNEATSNRYYYRYQPQSSAQPAVTQAK
jgi:capsular exopolysaccharide synthesis family protein